MTIREFADKHEKMCKVITKDGVTICGRLFLGDTEFDSSSGEDEIDIDTGSAYVSIPISHVESVNSL